MNFARKMNICVANHMIRIWPVPLVFCHHNYLIDPLPSFNAVCVCDFIHSICLWQYDALHIVIQRVFHALVSRAF